ncbi:MAG TPA: M1 family aminopeptidase [Bacteroidales bacterium]|nr:M1 family aminopeptidase [Bacteroidales bacterium]
MKRQITTILLLILAVTLVHAQTRPTIKGSALCSARKSAATQFVSKCTTEDSSPAHSFDAIKYTLDLDLYNCYVSPYPNSFSGSVVLTFQAVNALDRIKLNAKNYSIVIDSVRMAADSFFHAADTLTLLLDRTYSPGETADAKVYYHHKNVIDNAFYASGGFVFTDCEPEGARCWFPCWDKPSDKALLDLTARVKSTVKLGSNGRLADSTLNGDVLTYHWVSDQNVATYLMVMTSRVNYQLNIGYWHKLSNPSDSIPLRYYFNPGEDPSPVISIMPELTDWYSQNYIEHPFAKNGFAALNSEFAWGGMENQTLTSICPGCWYESLAAHEFAHQWFGDMITCATWADIWLNEGFATWSEAFWEEKNGGYPAYKANIDGDAAYFLQYNAGWALSNPAWATATPSVNVLFDYSITYMKGACVLHQLRYVLGDSLFFEVLHQYCADPAFRFQSATIADFNAKVNQVTGGNYDWFFQNWIYQPNYPVYQNKYEFFDLGAGQWKVDFVVDQVQSNPSFFQIPVEIRITFSDASDTTIRVMNTYDNQLFSWTFSKTPVSVSFDPDNQIVLKSASTVVGLDQLPEVSREVILYAPSPNPSGDLTAIRYELPAAVPVLLEITDLPGKVVRKLTDTFQSAGIHRMTFDCSGIVPGTYLVRFTAGNVTQVKKLIIAR